MKSDFISRALLLLLAALAALPYAWAEVGSPSPPCPEQWTCGIWSSCSGGVQTRECYDRFDCGTMRWKPLMLQNCSEEALVGGGPPAANLEQQGDAAPAAADGAADGSAARPRAAALRMVLVGAAAASLALAFGSFFFVRWLVRHGNHERIFRHFSAKKAKAHRGEPRIEPRAQTDYMQAPPSAPPLPTDPLRQYIEENLRSGYTKEQIGEALIQAGWPPEQVDAALRSS